VPNDWADIEEDRHSNARTIPIRLGTNWSILIIFMALFTTIVLSLVLLQLSQITFEIPFVLAFIAAGFFLLLLPAVRLYKTREDSYAMVLFNKASYYPLALLVIVVLKLIL
jgi:4-hydroxybenzoate polyprenyltransferase